MKKFWEMFKGKKEEEEKKLEAIQVEVTASCNMNCTFCPTTYQSQPEKEFMVLELFEEIVPYFSKTNWVYLQGWGEPLLHKDFWQMVQMAKATGAKVGFTTNGTLLNNNAVESIFTTGVDQISISIAGATEETHSRLRVGSTLEQIGTNIKALVKERQAKKLNWPKITISYMLSKDSINELSDALKLTATWGVDELYTTHIDYVFNDKVEGQKIFHCQDGQSTEMDKLQAELKQYQEYLDNANDLANNEKLSFRNSKLLFKEQEASCELNPDKFIFITVRGEVTPCTNLSSHSFGNIMQSDIAQILESEAYAGFCQPFKVREEALAKLMYIYGDCEPSLIRIEAAEEEYKKQLEKNSLPQPCQKCPKSYGV